jgi:hypothetical protein
VVYYHYLTVKTRVVIVLLILISASGLVGGCETSYWSGAAFPTKVQIRVLYGGNWSGVYGDASGSQSVEGSGTRTFTINNARSPVSAAFQKRDGSSNQLTVILFKDGNEARRSNTTAPYGKVSAGVRI